MDNGRGAVTVTSVWVALRQAAADRRIKAVVLEPDGLQSGWAKLEEIRADLRNFPQVRQAGLRLPAHSRRPRILLALAADRIYLGPEDPLMLKGMRAEILYFKNTLDKLGVTVDVEHAGKYKDFGDMFTRSDMSPETREVINSRGRRPVRQPGEAHRRRAPETAGPGARAHRPGSVYRHPGAHRPGWWMRCAFEDQMWGELKAKLHAGEPTKCRRDT